MARQKNRLGRFRACLRVYRVRMVCTMSHFGPFSALMIAEWLPP
jgi:hypothetical protein